MEDDVAVEGDHVAAHPAEQVGVALEDEEVAGDRFALAHGKVSQARPAVRHGETKGAVSLAEDPPELLLQPDRIVQPAQRYRGAAGGDLHGRRAPPR